MLALLVPLREGGGDWERFAGYAGRMWDERESFIRKAIGWVLRDAAKKSPDRVVRFLRTRAHNGSGVMMREAVKYLPATDRDALHD
jgi:3-methyladenine DNA glycosylase AlkD